MKEETSDLLGAAGCIRKENVDMGSYISEAGPNAIDLICCCWVVLVTWRTNAGLAAVTAFVNCRHLGDIVKVKFICLVGPPLFTFFGRTVLLEGSHHSFRVMGSLINAGRSVFLVLLP